MIKNMSVTYDYVRSRQLEGTYDLTDVKTGVWLTTSLRVRKGWGCVADELWPYDVGSNTWPEPEPPGLDLQAKTNRIGIYQRVNSVEEFCRGIYAYGAVQAGFQIDDSWYHAPNGVIPDPGIEKGGPGHCLCFYGYDKERIYFINSWGSDWGENGRGSLPYSYLSTRFLEGWAVTSHHILPDISLHPLNGSHIGMRKWKYANALGVGIVYGVEIIDPIENEIIAWGFAIERETSLDIEELFVRPKWRRQGYGSLITTEFSYLRSECGKKLHAWIPHPDSVHSNNVALVKILHRMDLTLRPSPVRWAAAVGIEPS